MMPDLDADRESTVASVIRLVQLHDAATADHLLATSRYAEAIALRLDCSKRMRDTVRLAALLHDVGKIGVRRDVLLKPGSLDDSEWAEMKRHPQLGGDLLAKIPILTDLAPIVRAHHERLDGKGYPDQLRGEEIPFEARIIAVADALDAMTAERPYRRRVTMAQALEIVRHASGSQFDTDAVAAAYTVFGRSHPNAAQSA